MSNKKEKFSSVFEAASRLGKDKKEGGKQDIPAQPLDLPTLPEIPKDLPPIESNEDVLDQFSRCEKLHHELESQVSDFCTKHNISLAEFRKKLDDPTQFSSSDWNNIRSQVNQVKEAIEKLAPEKEQNDQDTSDDSQQEKTQKKKPSMLTKRRWLSMQ